MQCQVDDTLTIIWRLFRRRKQALVVSRLVPETMRHFASKWYQQKKKNSQFVNYAVCAFIQDFIMIGFYWRIIQKFIFSYCSISWKNTLQYFTLLFVYQQTSSAIVCSDWPITVQFSSWFPARNWTCSIRRQFLALEKFGTRKVWCTYQFLVPVD